MFILDKYQTFTIGANGNSKVTRQTSSLKFSLYIEEDYGLSSKIKFQRINDFFLLSCWQVAYILKHLAEFKCFRGHKHPWKLLLNVIFGQFVSLRKQPKQRLRNEHRNSRLMMRHFQDLAASSSDFYFAWRRARNANEWSRGPMDCGKGEKKIREAKVSPVSSFPPSFVRKFLSRERRLRTRQKI